MKLGYDPDQRYLIFKVAGKLIGTDIGLVKRILYYDSPQKVPLARDYFDGLVEFEGKPIPFYNLLRAMGFDESKKVGENLIAVHFVKGIDIAFKIGSVITVAQMDQPSVEECKGKVFGVEKTGIWNGKKVYIINAENMI